MAEDRISGHLGHLTSDQEDKLATLWAALFNIFNLPVTAPDNISAENVTLSGDLQQWVDDCSPTYLRSFFWATAKHQHPDTLLLCFLRARKWDVEKALNMFVSMLRWRSQTVHLEDDIMVKGEAYAADRAVNGDPVERAEGEGFMLQLRKGKSFLHGVDKEGRPMCFIRAKLHRKCDQTQSSLERYTIYNIEMGRILLRAPVDSATLIFDLTGFGMANMDYEPIKFLSKTFEAQFPDSIGLIIVHGAPWIFWACWAIIRGFIDPVLAAKVQFTQNARDLSKHVPLSQIPRSMGGDEDWEYTYVEPREGENAKMEDTETKSKILKERDSLYDQFEKATIEWWNTGSRNSTEEKRTKVAQELTENYWRLDPYVRARSLYDRVGKSEDGKPTSIITV